jgi:anti-sigma factor RsiW
MQQLSDKCPRTEISSYIDGELNPAQEIELEIHLSGCSTCSAELNLQRQFLCALDAGLEDEPEIELPKNFTKVVVANAESRVSGLRKPKERFNAAFICSGLVLIMMFSLGAASGDVFGVFVNVLEKAAAVSLFMAHMAYDLAVGVVIIIRSLSSHLLYGTPVSFSFPALIGIPLFVISQVANLFRT